MAEKVRAHASSIEIDRLMGKDVIVQQSPGTTIQGPLRITAAYVQDKFVLDSGKPLDTSRVSMLQW